MTKPAKVIGTSGLVNAQTVDFSTDWLPHLAAAVYLFEQTLSYTLLFPVALAYLTLSTIADGTNIHSLVSTYSSEQLHMRQRVAMWTCSFANTSIAGPCE